MGRDRLRNVKGSLAYQASLNAARVPAQVDSPGLAAVSYGCGSPLRSCVSESKDKQPISPIGHTHVFLHELQALQQIIEDQVQLLNRMPGFQ